MLGYPWPYTLEREVAALTWPPQYGVNANHKSWIVTDSERSESSRADRGEHWNIVVNTDEIYWGCPCMPTRAFASPATSKYVIQLLNGEG